MEMHDSLFGGQRRLLSISDQSTQTITLISAGIIALSMLILTVCYKKVLMPRFCPPVDEDGESLRQRHVEDSSL